MSVNWNVEDRSVPFGRPRVIDSTVHKWQEVIGRASARD